MKVPQGYKQTEIGVIPEDWNVISIGDVFMSYPNASYTRDQLGNNGKVKYIHYGDIHTKYQTHLNLDLPIIPTVTDKQASRYTHLRNGDLILADASEDYAGVGKCVEIISDNNIDAISGLHTILLRDTKSIFVDRFRGYITQNIAVKSQIEKQAVGTKVYAISYNSIKECLLTIPTIEEQQKIAEALGDVDKLIATLDKKIAKKKLIKQAAMQQLLTGKKRLQGFNDGWITKKLGEIAYIYQPETISQDCFTLEGYDVYGANGVIGKYSKYNHTTDQILITCRGSSCGSITYSTGNCWITGNAMVINMDNCKIAEKKYIYYYLFHSDLSSIITGSGQPQIVRVPLQEYTIIIPQSKKEQQAIAKILSDMDEEILDLEHKRDKYQLLKNGMMQKLLTGQIRLRKSLADIIPLTPNGSRDIPLQAHIIAGHIVNELHNSYGFGRTKLQKSIHLIVYHCQLDLGNEFIRNTAGPDDQVLMNYIDGKFRQYNHVRIEKKMENGKHRYTYTPTTMISEVEQVYETYPSYTREKIDALLDKIKLMDLARAEIVSTLYAVWNNRIIKGELITDELLLNDFYAWSAHKSDFSRDLVFRGLDYMRSVGLVPTGWGKYINKK